MRVTRAYLAGLGTAGSLLAGAAILFVFASAFVSFGGWPEISAGVPASVLVVRTDAPQTLAAQSAPVASRRVLLAFAGRSVRPSGHATRSPATGAPQAGHATPVVPVAPGATAPTPSIVAPAPATAASSSSQAPAGQAPAGVGNVLAKTTGALGSGIDDAGSTLSKTVDAAGGGLANTVTKVTSGLGGALSKASASTGAAVTKTGNALAGTVQGVVTTVSHTVAGVVTTVGSIVSTAGSLLSGH